MWLCLIHFWTLPINSPLGEVSASSGQTKSRSASFLTGEWVLSLPVIPLCPGAHDRIQFLYVASLVRFWRHFRVNLKLIMCVQKTFSPPWQSAYRKIEFLTCCLFRISSMWWLIVYIWVSQRIRWSRFLVPSDRCSPVIPLCVNSEELIEEILWCHVVAAYFVSRAYYYSFNFTMMSALIWKPKFSLHLNLECLGVEY